MNITKKQAETIEKGIGILRRVAKEIEDEGLIPTADELIGRVEAMCEPLNEERLDYAKDNRI